jgi:large subunit ribosomal protein L18
MTKAKTSYIVKFRRRREQETDYKKRLALLKSGKPRLVVRKTNREVIVHLTTYNEKGDITHVHVSKKQLSSLGWNAKCNTPTAYLTGFLAGKLALKKGFKEAVLDISMNTPTKNAIVFAAAKGALDAGLSIPFSAEISEERIKGKHLGVEKAFEETKKKIESMK